MKKQLIKVVLLLAAPLMILQSCKDEEETKNTATVELGSASIKGRVTADAILNNGIQKDGLGGFTITATINTSDLVSNPSGTYPTRTYTAVTDANGNYTINVEANVKPVTITLSYSTEFYANQVTENKTNRRVRYFGAAAPGGSFTVGKGQTVTRDVNFPNYTADANLGLAKVTGIAYFRNDLCVGSGGFGGIDTTVSPVPANTVLIATWGSSELEVKTDANGKFEFYVETANNEFVTIKGRKFTAARKSNPGTGCETDPNYDYTHGGTPFMVTKNETFRVDSAIRVGAPTVIRFQ